MIKCRTQYVPEEKVRSLINWLNQGEAETLRSIALDCQTQCEITALENAANVAKGHTGYTASETIEFEKAQRYKIFLEVLDELKGNHKPVNLILHHTYDKSAPRS